MDQSAFISSDHLAAHTRISFSPHKTISRVTLYFFRPKFQARFLAAGRGGLEVARGWDRRVAQGNFCEVKQSKKA